MNNQTVRLELLSPGGQRQVDSTTTDQNGNFALKVVLPKGEQSIYNLRSGNDLIPLLVAPGERVTVSSLGNISRNYTVEGSEGSRLLRELGRIMGDGASRLDSLTNLYTHIAASDGERRKSVAEEYGREYIRIKRAQIAFIVTNSGSLAALYALYQRLPNDQTLFNGDSDMVYFRMVADSVGARLPHSPYVAALNAELEKMEQSYKVSDMFASAQQNSLSYPELELPDMYGKKIKLSSLAGKVILLEFWSAAAPRSQMLNAELKETYNRHSGKGFEVYQVSVDESKPLWVSSVQDQKLPWVSVCDFMGQRSPALRTYNITEVPSNFLIDQNGAIAGKNLFGADLDRKLASILK